MGECVGLVSLFKLLKKVLAAVSMVKFRLPEGPFAKFKFTLQ